MAALAALYRTNELPGHLRRAQDNGLTREEMAEVFTHLAFNAGWPWAVTAMRVAREVSAKHG